ncbi:hypothetical protein WR25_00326 [Diploscapter pachys]|uniref:Beta-mannosidase Ig-fold domain-containing protein n=1 Tax=Diploscapter pachys TaxID=2018661 RepID=A0A2A2LKG4_9BILA|nr:hypothetical protein WR25_00326 [Diploscapter pachys]
MGQSLFREIDNDKCKREGGVSSKPGDTHFGDIHFYNDIINLWLDSVYSTPRCTTEFGVQSVPYNSTWLKWISSDQFFYYSGTFNNRQHSPGKVLSNLVMIFSHLPVPPSCANYTNGNISNCQAINGSQFLNRFAYLSQINQGITYKVQTEHYRRFRNLTNDKGEGHTMCSLYWQLNDVWAATTWSSIDFELKWKAAHYEARRFFDNLIVVLFVNGHDLGVTVVNDGVSQLKNAKIVVNQYAWSKGFEPVYNENQTMDISALSAQNVNFNGFDNKLSDGIDDYLFESYIEDDQGNQISRRNYLYPDEFYKVDIKNLGDVSVESVSSSDGSSYSIQITSTGLSPFTWIDLRSPYLGWFSDNAFTMTTSSKTVTLNLIHPQQLTKDDFIVCNVKNCGL